MAAKGSGALARLPRRGERRGRGEQQRDGQQQYADRAGAEKREYGERSDGEPGYGRATGAAPEAPAVQARSGCENEDERNDKECGDPDAGRAEQGDPDDAGGDGVAGGRE